MKAVIPSPQTYYLFRENYKINILQNYIGISLTTNFFGIFSN